MRSVPPRLLPDAMRPALQPGREPTRLGSALAAAVAGHAILVALLLWVDVKAELAVPEPPDTVQMVFAEAPAIPEPPSLVQDAPLEAPSEMPTAETPPEPPVETPPSADPPTEATTPASVEPPPPSLPEPPPIKPTAPAPPAVPRPAAPVQPRRLPPPPPNLRPAPPSRPQAAQPAPAPAVSPAPATSAPASALAAPAGIDPAWRSALNGWLAARRRYPELARQREEEGVVGATFTVDRDGRVLEVVITRPSGSSLLDDAVGDMLRGGRVPPFPASMPQAQASVTVNIRYTLEHWR